MRDVDVARWRLRSQHLVGPHAASAGEAVGSLLAVQAENPSQAAWAVAARTHRPDPADLATQLDEGAVVRTHVLRPTWHFVSPADIRWMLQLTAPRVQALSATYYRQCGLEAHTLARGDEVLAKTLQGGQHLTRAELAIALRAAGVPTQDLRLTLLVMHAELQAAICSGPRRGKQFTYAALDERAPAARTLARDEALVALARRYFASHGPAQARDFAWWSGLKIADATAAISALDGELEPLRAGGQTFWVGTRTGSASRRPRAASPLAATHAVRLLPSYDEYLVSCRDHAALLDPRLLRALGAAESILSSHVITGDGRVVGDWQREIGRDRVTVQVRLAVPGDRALRTALETEVERYGRFLGLRAHLQIRAGARKSGKS
jgi:winged helix DNA-binding protein